MQSWLPQLGDLSSFAWFYETDFRQSTVAADLRIGV